MKKVSCDCGAEFKTHNEEELYQIVKLHSKNTHNMDATREQFKKMAKDA